jgi:hypothetical protein
VLKVETAIILGDHHKHAMARGVEGNMVVVGVLVRPPVFCFILFFFPDCAGTATRAVAPPTRSFDTTQRGVLALLVFTF